MKSNTSASAVLAKTPIITDQVRCVLLWTAMVTASLVVCLCDAEDFIDANFSSPPNQRPHLVLDAKGFSGRIGRVALSDNGKWLAGVADKTVRIWNLQTGQMHAALRGYQEPDGFHIGYIDSLTFAPDNQHLIVGVSDNSQFGSTRVYDLKQPDTIKQLIAGHTGCTRGVTFSNSGRWLATWGCDGNIVFYRRRGGVGDWQIEFKVGWGRTLRPSDLSVPEDFFTFTPDERYLGFNFVGRSVDVVSINERRVLPTLNQIPASVRALHNKHNNCRGPFGKWRSHKDLITVDSSKARLEPHLVLIGTGVKKKFFAASFDADGDDIAIHEHRYETTAVTWNEKCNKVASADSLGEIHVWDPQTGKLLHPIVRPVTQSLWNVRWSGDGQKLQFSDTNYPEGRWNFNRYGGVDQQMDLTNFQVSKLTSREASAIEDRPIRPTATHDRLGEIELMILKTSDENSTKTPNEWILYARETNDTSRRYVLDPWVDPAVSTQFRNLRIRIPKLKFGNPTCMQFIDPSDNGRGNTCLIGTDAGKLIEANIEILPNGRVALRITKEFMGHTAKITSLDISPDRQKLVSSSLDGTLRIWPIRAARTLGDIDFATDGTGVSDVPPASRGYAAGIRAEDTLLRFDDGSFYERIRKIQSGQYRPGQSVRIELLRGADRVPSQRSRFTVNVRLADAPDMVLPLASALLTRDNERVIWTPEGYYESSSQGGQFVGWHINNARHQTARFYPLGQFQKQYYQPKAVRYAIRNSDTATALNQVAEEVVGFEVAPALADVTRNELTKRLPPKIDILSPVPNFVSDDPKLTVVSRVRGTADSVFSQVRYRVDGHSVPGRPRQTSRRVTSDGVEVWYEQSIDLPAGEHEIQLSLNSSNQTRGSQTVNCTIRGGISTNAEQGRLFLLAIGISNYQNDEFRLGYARSDAEAFASAWENLKSSAYSQTIKKVLTDETATSQTIRQDGFAWLLSQSIAPNDTVIVYLAGHGLFDDYDEWYFAGHELDIDRLISTAISDAELDSFLSKIPTNTILFTDTCHAGGFVSDSRVRSHPQSGTDIWRGRGHVVFASCLAEESSFESPSWNHGAFTKAILEFLSSPQADYNRDGELTFNEMVLFVQTHVRKITGKAQNPTVEMPSSVSNIRFTGSAASQ
ncbi:caspase family protein [Aporhodopirellula aestuarii]|uniref:Caspase family protein n=1 Tax=Aporhodopirellula aestuarii TaxID=2950107 RepID=A0ABT0U7Q7_9BACT|nr:caspase family protein [Aporhodopirellula aestuarii]MCM2372933.1 caspase family protein [Aporhodopirellula aestuarii]